jgi:hypothetical protein
LVGAEHCQLVTGDIPSFLHQPFEYFTQLEGVIQNYRIGKQIDIFDMFFTLFCGEGFDLAIIPKREPLAKGIELLDFVRGWGSSMNGPGNNAKQ